MPNCFVPGCKSGYASKQGIKNRHFFTPPKHLLSKWETAIGRWDRKLNSRSYICDIHFNEDALVKVDSFIVGGEKVELPRMRWTIKRDAVPNKFPYLTRKKTNRIQSYRDLKKKNNLKNLTNNASTENSVRPANNTLLSNEGTAISENSCGSDDQTGHSENETFVEDTGPKDFERVYTPQVTGYPEDNCPSTSAGTSTSVTEAMGDEDEFMNESVAGTNYGHSSLQEAVKALKEISEKVKATNEFQVFAQHVAKQLEELPLEDALVLQSEIQTLITSTRVRVLRDRKFSIDTEFGVQ